MIQPRLRWLILPVLAMLVTVGFYRQLLGPRGFESDDRAFYLRVTQYQKEIRNGHWPQTLPDALGGGGHAFPRFYPPVSHLAAAGMSALVGDAVLGAHLSVFLATLLSVALMGVLVRRLTQSSLALLVSMLLFASFPYRFVLLYVRGAFAEAWSLAMLPLVALGAVACVKDGRPPRWWPIAIALLILSHTVMTAWVLPVLLGVVGFAAPHSTRRSFLRAASLMTIWSFGLAAFYLVPMAVHLPSVRANSAEIMWALPEDLARSSAAAYLGFHVEAVAWGLLGLSVVVLVGLVRAARRGGFADRLMWGALAAVLLYAAVMVAPETFWQFTPLPLRMIQFPFRLFGPIAFGGALAVGVLVGMYHRRWLQVGWALLACLFVVTGWHGGGIGVARPILGNDLPALLSGEYRYRSLTVVGEFLPIGTAPVALADAVHRTRENIGSGALESWTETKDGFQATIVTDRKRVVDMPLVYYDFLDVRHANKGRVDAASHDGLLSVQADSGQTELLIRRRLPFSLKIGFLISLSATVLLFVPRRWMRLSHP